MWLEPVTLEGAHVRMEPLREVHAADQQHLERLMAPRPAAAAHA